MTSRSRLVIFLALALALATACSARSSLPEPQGDAGSSTSGSPVDGGEKRACPPECAVGHECCAGSCDGPPVPMPSDCCTCLAGEVSSFECGGLCNGSP